jgi:general secretion pathway protein J
VEVLVALFIMAILAAMAFRGIGRDLPRTRRRAGRDRPHAEAQCGMSQFEYDVSQMIDTQVIKPLDFNGNTLRITRRTPAGIELVLWALQDRGGSAGRASPSSASATCSRCGCAASSGRPSSGGATTVLENVTDFQVYCYRNGWSNCQSSGQYAGRAWPGGWARR